MKYAAPSFKGNKQSLPSKPCLGCGRAMTWRKRTRAALQVKNVARLNDAQRQAVAQRARAICRGEVGTGP